MCRNDFLIDTNCSFILSKYVLHKCHCNVVIEHVGGRLASQPEVSKESLKDSVRVATVDNFQGEESTIIILSLVRNNK